MIIPVPSSRLSGRFLAGNRRTLRGLRELAALDGVALIGEIRPAVAQLAQGLALTNAMEAWSLLDGRGIAVGIMDSGIDSTHERLGGAASRMRR